MGDAAPDTPVEPVMKTKRELLEERWGALDNVYARWRSRHMEIGDKIAPDRSWFIERGTSTSKGHREDRQIYDATATQCSKRLTSAIETGTVSPVREWARLTTTLGEDVATEYLYDTQRKFFYTMAKSNGYKVLGSIIRDDVDFGTGVMWMEKDPKTVVRFIHFPVGSYRLATNAQGKVDTFYRRFEMTTGHMVREFGLDACSQTVQDQWRQGKYDVWHWIQHSCEPRELRQYGKIDAKNKPWESCWFEIAQADKRKLLRESGFDRQPFVAVRWDYVGQNAYGTDCPGMQAIGDTNQLQDFTLGGAGVVAQIVKPAMNVPAGVLNASAVPGARTAQASNSPAKMEPVYVPQAQAVTVIANEKQELRAHIREAYLNNILFFLTGSPTPQDVQKTATEIQARKDEGLLQLSSAYKIFSDEGLDPMVNFVLAAMQEAGMLDPPPPELHEQTQVGGVRAVVHVEYINNLAAAQRLLGISAVERLLNETMAIFNGTKDESVLDNIDFDQAIHVFAETLGVKPSLVRAEDVVKAMRKQRAQRQAEAAAAQQSQQSAVALQKLSQTDPNTLDQLGQRFGPYAQAQLRA